MTDVTQILSQIESGDPSAAEQLLPLVYDELRKLAAAKLAQEKPGQTLQATALVHEAYLRLVRTTSRPTGMAGGIFSRLPPRRCDASWSNGHAEKRIKPGGGQANALSRLAANDLFRFSEQCQERGPVVPPTKGLRVEVRSIVLLRSLLVGRGHGQALVKKLLSRCCVTRVMCQQSPQRSILCVPVRLIQEG